MPADGACEDAALDLASHAHELVNGVMVADVGNVPACYRTGVEVCGDVVGGSVYGLEAHAVVAVVGAGLNEGREQRKGGCGEVPYPQASINPRVRICT